METRLTTDQINHIDYVLRNDYSFEYFDDLRIELLDHIASDVELEMRKDNLCFDDALPKVLYKWKDEISWDRTSKFDSVPKMVSKLWKKLDWKYNYYILPLTAILCFGSIPFRKEEGITYAMYIVGFVGLFLGGYLMKLFSKNKFNTVLSIYAEDQIKIYVGILVLALLVNMGLNYSDGDVISRPALFVIIHTTLVFVMRTIIMRKNIKIENQLLKVI
jgi:hypothetical protein